MNLKREKWSEKILNFLELEESRLADVLPSGTPVGVMKPDLIMELGFKSSPIVSVGGHDQACGALGAG